MPPYHVISRINVNTNVVFLTSNAWQAIFDVDVKVVSEINKIIVSVKLIMERN